MSYADIGLLADGDVPPVAYFNQIRDDLEWLAPDGWTAPTYTSGWGNLTGVAACGFRLEGDIVRFRGGVIRSSGSSTTPFTLPAALWPAAALYLPVIVNGAGTMTIVGVTTAGVLSVGASYTSGVHLDGLTYALV